MMKKFIGQIHTRYVNDTDQYVWGWAKFSTERYQYYQHTETKICFPDHFSDASTKRQAEYLAGRLVSHHILQQFEGVDFYPGTSDNGAPTWPLGYIGSISHTSDTVVVFIAKTLRNKLIGVDIENIINKDVLSQIHSCIVDIEEWKCIRNMVPSSALTDEQLGTLVFSAKESLFKALNPYLDIFFDFSAAKITNIILKKNEFSIRLLFDGDALYRKNKVITGRFYFFQKKVLTFIIL